MLIKFNVPFHPLVTTQRALLGRSTLDPTPKVPSVAMKKWVKKSTKNMLKYSEKIVVFLKNVLLKVYEA